MPEERFIPQDFQLPPTLRGRKQPFSAPPITGALRDFQRQGVNLYGRRHSPKDDGLAALNPGSAPAPVRHRHRPRFGTGTGTGTGTGSGTGTGCGTATDSRSWTPRPDAALRPGKRLSWVAENALATKCAGSNKLPRALRTEPKDLDSVRNLSKTVFTAQTGSPALDSRSLNLHSLAAVTANQMMVVVFSFAAAVENLTVSTTENIDLLVISHGLEDPVGGSQRDLLAAVLKQTVKLLGTYKVIKRIQSTPNSQPLPGNPGLGSPPRGRWLR